MDSFETPLLPSDQETSRTGGYGGYLHERLRNQAESKISSTFTELSSVFEHYGPELIMEEHNDFMIDHILNFKTLFDLQSVGLLDSIVQVPLHESVEADTLFGKVKIERLDSHRFGMKLRETDRALPVRADIRNQMDQSEIVTVIQEALHNHANKIETNSQTKQFSLESQPLATAVALSSLNFFGWSESYYDYVPGEDPNNFALKKLTQAFVDKARFDPDGKIIDVQSQIDRGVTLVFTPTQSDVKIEDIGKTGWRLSFVTHPEAHMLERANQAKEKSCKAFIDRPTGIAFIDALEASQLRFSPDFEDFLSFDHTYTFDDRYGGAYAQLTRSLAKIIWSGDVSKLAEIIVGEDGETVNSQNIESFVNHLSGDNGLLVFQKMLRQIMTRRANNTQSDIPATSKRISISAGACFDVYGYYIDAQSSRMLDATEINGNAFLEKTLGAHTYINAKPIMFRGVEIPKGGLFVDDEEGSYAFLRLTPFTFDKMEDMVSTFGTEILKGDDKKNTYQRIQNLMGLISGNNINQPM